MAEQRIESELSGTVSKIECAEGSVVAEGDTVLIIESMKMEFPIVSPAAGTIKKLLVEAGGLVSDGEVVAILVTGT